MNLGQTCLEGGTFVRSHHFYLSIDQSARVLSTSFGQHGLGGSEFFGQELDCFECVASESMEIMAQFNHQSMANLLWLVAFISFVHEPLLDVGSFATVAMTDFPAQELVNIA